MALNAWVAKAKREAQEAHERDGQLRKTRYVADFDARGKRIAIPRKTGPLVRFKLKECTIIMEAKAAGTRNVRRSINFREIMDDRKPLFH